MIDNIKLQLNTGIYPKLDIIEYYDQNSHDDLAIRMVVSPLLLLWY